MLLYTVYAAYTLADSRLVPLRACSRALIRFFASAVLRMYFGSDASVPQGRPGMFFATLCFSRRMLPTARSVATLFSSTRM